MICSISLDQALGIWSELWEAYYGDNAFGESVAEIYAYRLIGHNPICGVCRLPDGPGEPGSLQRLAWETGLEARNNLAALLRRFEQETGCRIEIDGSPLFYWQHSASPLLHRCHVRVIRKEETP